MQTAEQHGVTPLCSVAVVATEPERFEDLGQTVAGEERRVKFIVRLVGCGLGAVDPSPGGVEGKRPQEPGITDGANSTGAAADSGNRTGSVSIHAVARYCSLRACAYTYV